VYLLYFCPNTDRSKINKQGCDLARKGHVNGYLNCWSAIAEMKS